HGLRATHGERGRDDRRDATGRDRLRLSAPDRGGESDSPARRLPRHGIALRPPDARVGARSFVSASPKHRPRDAGGPAPDRVRLHHLRIGGGRPAHRRAARLRARDRPHPNRPNRGGGRVNSLRGRHLVAMLVLGLSFATGTAWALASADLIKRGVAALKDGKTEAALDAFTQAQRLEPNGARPHYYIATALERLGAPDSARAEYEAAIRINPKYVEAHTGLGNLQRKMAAVSGDSTKAAEGTHHLELAFKYDPKDAAAVYSLGQAYLRDKRYDDAEKIFRKGTLLKQGRALFLSGTALALEGKGSMKEAEELFIRARESDPNNLRVRLDLGGFYERKKI